MDSTVYVRVNLCAHNGSQLMRPSVLGETHKVVLGGLPNISFIGRKPEPLGKIFTYQTFFNHYVSKLNLKFDKLTC